MSELIGPFSKKGRRKDRAGARMRENFLQWFNNIAKNTTIREALEKLSQYENPVPPGEVDRIVVVTHYGDNDADITAFSIGENASLSAVNGAIFGHIDEDTFKTLEPGKWYLEEATQKYGESIRSRISKGLTKKDLANLAKGFSPIKRIPARASQK